MIEYMKPTDSIFESGAEALVCPVNCVGVMGAGLAKEFKKRFPQIMSIYKGAADACLLKIGQTSSYPKHIYGAGIVLFPTKDHWRHPSEMEYIRQGLLELLSAVKALGFTSIAIPALGCGLGGLDWNVVRPLIEEAFKDLPDVRVMLYPPRM